MSCVIKYILSYRSLGTRLKSFIDGAGFCDLMPELTIYVDSIIVTIILFIFIILLLLININYPSEMS